MLHLLSFAYHLPSARLLASTVSRACAALDVPADDWLEPEDAAWAIARAIDGIELPAAKSPDAMVLPLQGEFRFASADHAGRYAAAESAAYAGCAQAQHTLGLLLYGGVGGCEADARLSAFWHAAAAAQGNLDALATLGGCVRRGVGAAKDEAVGVALIQAAAAAGSPCGLCKLGVLHEERTLPAWAGLADASEAARLFARAAELGSALGLFHDGWAKVHGVGVARDVPAGMRAWRAAADRAPDDGAEEAAYHLYQEQRYLSAVERKDLRPDSALRLSAELEFEPAVAALRRRLSASVAQRKSERRRRAREPRPKEKFVRNDKARAATASEVRGYLGMDGDDR